MDILKGHTKETFLNWLARSGEDPRAQKQAYISFDKNWMLGLIRAVLVGATLRLPILLQGLIH